MRHESTGPVRSQPPATPAPGAPKAPPRPTKLTVKPQGERLAEFRQLTKLVHPFPDRLIQKNPSGCGTYVKHSVVVERLLDVLGGVDFELIEVLRGHVDGKPGNPSGSSARAKAGTPALDNAVVGVLARMVASVDGKTYTITEVGDCESPHNWPHDGARLKDAASDAYKRCAMRLGVGLHLWAQDHFYISDKFLKQDQEKPA